MTISGVDTSSTTNTAAATTGSSEMSQLSNPQLFLQLLIAELQNQDPTNPLDPSTILQQTSELSNVEAMTSMTNEVSGEQATGLIGMQVSATVNGSPVTGTVSAVNLSATGEPTLTVSGQSGPIALSSVTQVTDLASSSSGSGSSSTTGSTSGGQSTSGSGS
ncbi:MAG TPA: flagellar hook capping FlgD N-terminal domain-containing protein [Acidimicrobiales bacterium]|nr:flagellar hook capping FlgD N-terminal domain-containing protein [Acidimicrobiales bacterium]